MNKICLTCKTAKPVSEFHKDSTRKDGHAARCKVCAIAVARAHYEKNRNKRQEYQRNHRASNSEMYSRLGREYSQRYPERILANRLINNAVLAGKLPHATSLACEVCGQPARHYHHPDYGQPLEVIPLCASCHRREHGIGDISQ